MTGDFDGDFADSFNHVNAVVQAVQKLAFAFGRRLDKQFGSGDKLPGLVGQLLLGLNIGFFGFAVVCCRQRSVADQMRFVYVFEDFEEYSFGSSECRFPLSRSFTAIITVIVVVALTHRCTYDQLGLGWTTQTADDRLIVFINVAVVHTGAILMIEMVVGVHLHLEAVFFGLGAIGWRSWKLAATNRSLAGKLGLFVLIVLDDDALHWRAWVRS